MDGLLGSAYKFPVSQIYSIMFPSVGLASETYTFFGHRIFVFGFQSSGVVAWIPGILGIQEPLNHIWAIGWMLLTRSYNLDQVGKHVSNFIIFQLHVRHWKKGQNPSQIRSDSCLQLTLRFASSEVLSRGGLDRRGLHRLWNCPFCWLVHLRHCGALGEVCFSHVFEVLGNM